MAKVILITSREIIVDRLINIPLSFTQYTGDDDVKNKYLAQFGCFWPKEIISIKQRAGEYERRFNSALTVEDATNLAQEVLGFVEKANGTPFQFGVFHEKRKGVYVYFAEEYPFNFSYTEFKDDPDRQRYLNSLIAEIEGHLKESGVTEDVEWQIFSHDKDWCVDANNSVLDKSETIGKVKDEFVFLKKVLSNPNTTIRVFQHITSDDTYLYVKYLIENESLIPSFEDFKETGERQKQFFKNYMQQPNDANWKELMQIDTNYPFMPFDIVENPLKEESYSK